MMKTLLSGFLVALLIAAAVPARAQVGVGRDVPFLEVNGHVGSLNLPDRTGGHELMMGGRAVVSARNGWGVGGNVDFINGNGVNFTMYSAEVHLTIPTHAIGNMFLAAGVGAITATFEDEVEDGEFEFDEESNTVMPLAMGLLFHDSDQAPPYIGYRVEVRDNVIFENEDFDQETHNWELTGGVSFLF
jgi:hypothetical protein